MRRVFLALVAAVLLGAVSVASVHAQTPEDRPEYPVDTVTITTERGGRYDFQVELATSPRQMAFGLMFVRDMPADAGMMFLVQPERPVSFWMRNTYIPLDMLFIDTRGRIINIEHRAEPLTETSRRSDGPVRAVLEINGGLSRMLGIGPGDRVEHPWFDAG